MSAQTDSLEYQQILEQAGGHGLVARLQAMRQLLASVEEDDAGALRQLMAERGIPPGSKEEMLIQMLRRRNEEQRVERGKQVARKERLRRRLRQLLQEYGTLVERDAVLADALGACRCWGDPDCPTCEGRGGPGWRQPERAAFTKYVVPLLLSLGLLRDESSPTNPTKE